MFAVGPLMFHVYGLLIGLGILLGAYVGAKVVKVKMDEVFDGLIYVVAGGLIGARLYHVIDFGHHYLKNPMEIVKLWHGGMGIYGGMVGGLLGLMVWPGIRRVNSARHSPGKQVKKIMSKGHSPFTAINKKKLLKYLDVVGLGLPVGQAVGRWGNYFNQELYGEPTLLPWGILIKPENRLMPVVDYERFHPLFLYESLWALVGLGVLMWLVKLKKIKLGKGRVLITYLGWYGIGRFLLEFLRLEAWLLGGVNIAQVISLGLVGLAVWFWLKK